MNNDKPPGERKPNSNIPESFQTPNYFIDAMLHLLTPPEFAVLMFMSRHIFGWTDCIAQRENNISLSMFLHGFTSKDGRKFNGVGLGKNAVIAALGALTSFRIVEAVGDPGPKGQLWRFPPDDRNVKYDEMEQRQRDAHAANTKRSAAARQKRQEKNAPPVDTGLSDKPQETPRPDAPPSVPQTTSGMSDIPAGGMSDTPEVVYPTNGIKLIDKPIEETHKETHVPRDADAHAPEMEPERPPHPPGQYALVDGVLTGPFNNYNAARAFAPTGRITQTPPRDLVAVPPAKPGRKPKADGPRLEQPPADVKDAFALLCYNGTAITGASWARLIKAWNRLEKPPAEKFATFTRWWKACDWRGVKGQRPTPEQVVSEWDVAQNWDGATPVAVTPYQQNYRSKAELDAERNRINIEKGMEKARQWQAEREAKRGKS